MFPQYITGIKKRKKKLSDDKPTQEEKQFSSYNSAQWTKQLKMLVNAIKEKNIHTAATTAVVDLEHTSDTNTMGTFCKLFTLNKCSNMFKTILIYDHIISE